MNELFLDTSFLIAAIRTDDQNHQAAREWESKVNVRYVTTEFVLTEFMDNLSRPPVRGRADHALRLMMSDRQLTIIEASSHWFVAGLDVFRRHADKNWGLTDCISFAVMRSRRIDQALTADRHFEQAGFTALLRRGAE